MIGSATASFFGLDASEWQAVFAGVAALGTVGAAVVAAVALRYFKSQTEAMQAANDATRKQVDVQERRWEDEQRRERQRAHAAVRPFVDLRLGDGRIHPANELGVNLAFSRGRTVRDVAMSVVLEGRDVVAECVPPGWPEIAVDGQGQFNIRASAVAVGDRATLRVTYLDALGARVASTFPLRVTDAEHLGFARDLELELTTTDDL
jgi:hypothetical protein